MNKMVSIVCLLVLILGISGDVMNTDQQLFLGVNMHPLQDAYLPEKIPEQVQLASSIGVNIISFDIHWAWLDPNHASFSGWDSTQLGWIDSFLAQVREKNVQIAALVTETPCWASSDPNKDCDEGLYEWRYPPADPDDFADFLEVLVGNYGNDIDYWIIWGEPNTPYRWINPDPADYTDLLQSAYQAIKGVNPTAKVISGSLAPVDAGGETLSVFEYLEGMYAHGAKGYFDILAYNPYTDGNSPYWYNPAFPAVSFSHSVPLLRSIMLEYGDSSPIWLTEVGWSTVSESCVNCWVDTLPTTEEEQAEYFGDVITIASGWPYVEAIIVYELIDMLDPYSDEENLEFYFGVFRRDFSAKPIVDTLSAYTLPKKIFLPFLLK